MKLSLGTAQFGLDYGITNVSGQVSTDVVGEILDTAACNGIGMIDTAIAYGNSEQVLGQFDLSSFLVTSKIPSLQGTEHAIEQLTHESLERLGVDSLFGLMLHSEDDALHGDGQYLSELQHLKQQGLVQKIGASFYSPEKALHVVGSGMVDLIQIPANQLDSRFERSGLYEVADNMGVEVHVRSLFLQGLLAVDRFQRPVRFQSHVDLLRYDEACQRADLSQLEFALMYLVHHRLIHYGVLGCTSPEQLKEIISAYLKVKQMSNLIYRDLFSDDEILLNPSKW